MSEPIVPFRALTAPTPEPEAVLKFGEIEVRLPLTYLRHISNCLGCGPMGASTFLSADLAMGDAIQAILRAMREEIDRGRPDERG